MPRYFIELSYKGTNYSGFQIQQNANSIQAEIEKALQIFFRESFELTGSSRTDAGVHALQNFFHFDADNLPEESVLENSIYNLNAILPEDIVIKRIYEAKVDAHCRFDAISREYKYFVYQHKEPFLADRAFYFPYKLDIELLQEAANILTDYNDFTSFSKRNTQVKTFLCSIIKSEWLIEKDTIVYNVKANRFLRGMVRGLAGTMLKVGTGKLSLEEFISVIESKDSTKADFSVPPQALFLVKVEY
ncbi:tRNA pseudouridine(38-40) synthase TruA [Ferruginibacter albus]|uniref:tRNA pseudouridine(38-40) synthase TruA n=1 Tax=Ferruginibacter albus TaxID=2875540 RepID=UPI001CC4BD21|nr:tRNA pseudouridine(38-40) synthase TruA [Ferruginibacter albus]UAY51532.1 tRNA pseudouridine(38-40) synthase TruA [Ferruginibacter albus]